MNKILCLECGGRGYFSYSDHEFDWCSCEGKGYKMIGNLEYIKMIEMKEPIVEYDSYVHDQMLEL